MNENLYNSVNTGGRVSVCDTDILGWGGGGDREVHLCIDMYSCSIRVCVCERERAHACIYTCMQMCVSVNVCVRMHVMCECVHLLFTLGHCSHGVVLNSFSVMGINVHTHIRTHIPPTPCNAHVVCKAVKHTLAI